MHELALCFQHRLLKIHFFANSNNDRRLNRAIPWMQAILRQIKQRFGRKSRCAGGHIMNDQDMHERIVCDPKIMLGKPVIKGTRLSVDFILNLLAHGATSDAVLDEYEGLSPQDVRACLLFAS